MIRRKLEERAKEVAQWFPVVAVLGPPKSGKKTLVQKIFSQHRYVSLEDFDVRALAHADPRGFLSDYSTEQGIILDEIQHAPDLLSYIQTIVDKEKKKGFFIITGSQNFLLNEAITQTLAGRIGILTLLPLSIAELQLAELLPQSIEEAVFQGSYPGVYSDGIPAEKLYQNYIKTYIERDVRQVKNVENLVTFQHFLQLCAGRTGQLLNMVSLGNDCGIDQKTVRAWLSVLEASYLIVLLQPYYKNFGKRLIKSPKLYFIDTGVACSLLRIRNSQELLDHYLKGGLTESFIISDLMKQYYNRDQHPPLYFWRDHSGYEIDCLIEQASALIPIEIKAGKTVSSSYFDQLAVFTETTGHQGKSFVIYTGDQNQNWPAAKVLTWQSAGDLVDIIEK